MSSPSHVRESGTHGTGTQITKEQNMKIHLPKTSGPNRLALLGTLAALAIGSAVGIAGTTQSDYVAHEWGTFTSVQGADGALLDWRPLESSRLPKFVYDW